MKVNTMGLLSRVPNFIAALILLQTLFFKFSAAPESVYIFTKVGLEPWGRIGSGVAELIAGILLLWPAYAWLGAGIALGVMAGALMSHLTILGIEVQGDGGYLFILALIVFLASVYVLIRDKDKPLALLAQLRKN
jgi:putative oxidoreductase